MIDGEMHGDAALVEAIRNDRMPDSPLKGSANILVMPNMEAARISYNLLRVSSSEGVTVGPVLMGVAKPVHVLTPIASVRRIVNMVALAVVEAQTNRCNSFLTLTLTLNIQGKRFSCNILVKFITEFANNKKSVYKISRYYFIYIHALHMKVYAPQQISLHS